MTKRTIDIIQTFAAIPPDHITLGQATNKLLELSKEKAIISVLGRENHELQLDNTRLKNEVASLTRQLEKKLELHSDYVERATTILDISQPVNSVSDTIRRAIDKFKTELVHDVNEYKYNVESARSHGGDGAFNMSKYEGMLISVAKLCEIIDIRVRELQENITPTLTFGEIPFLQVRDSARGG